MRGSGKPSEPRVCDCEQYDHGSPGRSTAAERTCAETTLVGQIGRPRDHRSLVQQRALDRVLSAQHLAHMGPVRADVVVVDAESRDGTAEIVADFPGVRLLRCRNGGFAFANNRGLMTCDARYVLFLNPDTAILQGNLSDLIAHMDARPDIGLVGVRQVDGEGHLDMTIRRFPNALRALGDALSAERLPGRPRWLGERALDLAAYDHEAECDWTTRILHARQT